MNQSDMQTFMTECNKALKIPILPRQWGQLLTATGKTSVKVRLCFLFNNKRMFRPIGLTQLLLYRKKTSINYCIVIQ